MCCQYHAPVQSSFVQIYHEAPVLSWSPNRAPPAPRNFVILTWLAETENRQKYDPTSTNGMWCGGNHKSVKLFFCSYRFLPSSRWDVQPTGQNSQRCGRAMARRCQNAGCRIYVEL